MLLHIKFFIFMTVGISVSVLMPFLSRLLYVAKSET